MSYSPMVHGNQAVPRNTRRAFLISGTANRGCAVCYNYDIIDATAEQTTGSSIVSAGVTTWCDARRLQVEAPTTKNNLHFAGVIDEASDGKVAPAWVLIHEPGSVCEIRATSHASAGVSAVQNTGGCKTFTISTSSTGVACGLTCVHPNGAFSFSGLPGAGTAMCLSEITAGGDTSKAFVMAELQTGRPSGGVMVIGSTSTLSVYEAILTCIKHGRVVSSTQAAVSNNCFISIGAPTFVGQELLIDGAAGATMQCTIGWTLGISPITSGAGTPAAVTCSYSILSGRAMEFVHVRGAGLGVSDTTAWEIMVGANPAIA